VIQHSSFEFRNFFKGIRWESNPCLLVHSQACSGRYTTETMSFSSSTRSRTRTSSFEARNDFRFTIELKYSSISGPPGN
jgi:hypothetical protein